MENYMIDTQARINNFAEQNESELAQEFAARLSKQLNALSNSSFDNRKEVDNYVFENDVLEKTCKEENCDFDWNAARDLQRDVIDAVSEFHNLDNV